MSPSLLSSLVALALAATPSAAPTHAAAASPAHPDRGVARHGTGAPVAADDGERISEPGFGTVTVYRPQGTPKSLVLFLSGDGGWDKGVLPMARRLRAEGALVAGISVPTYVKTLEAASAECVYPAGDLETLGRSLELRYGFPAYVKPILVGYSSGATLVYGALAQAPWETFAGGLSLGFCPDVEMKKHLCRGRGLTVTPRTRPPKGYDLGVSPGLGAPWYVMQGAVDQVCDPPATKAFVEQIGSAHLVWLPKVGHGYGAPGRWEPQYVASYRALATPPPPPKAPSIAAVADLPLVEVPAASDTSSPYLAVMLTGDGGWADLDKGVAAGLAAKGVPAIGWSSLQYYWTPRTPEAAAADLARILEHYLSGWQRERAILVGYSFGADVLPFLVTRLPAELRARVAAVALVGLSPAASFEFHVSEWLGADHAESPTKPEIERLGGAGTRVLCVRGEDEHDSACGSLPAHAAETVTVPGGHHFGGDYARLAELILGRATAPGTTPAR